MKWFLLILLLIPLATAEIIDIGDTQETAGNGKVIDLVTSTQIFDLFIELLDTPFNYAGSEGFCVAVNGAGTGLLFQNCTNSTGGDGAGINESFANATYLRLDTANDPLTGSLNLSSNNLDEVENITLGDRLFIGGTDHWLTRGAEPIFNGIATESFWFHHEEEHPGGTITFLLTSLSEGVNKTMFLTQVGLNNSAGVLGNSWMVIPNNLTQNLSVLSNCFLVAAQLGKTLRVFCDTTDTGADLIVQDDIQSWGRLFVDQGIRSENEADFIMNEFDFNIAGGDLHLRNSRIEEVGFAEGDNITLLAVDFSAGLDPFVLLTTSGNPNEWADTASSDCFDSPCARASRITPSADSIIEANFSTTNVNDLNLSFRLNTTNLDSGDLFNVTVNNNIGSGEVEVYSISDGVDENQLVSVILPSSMNDQAEVSLRYHCEVNVINEQCLVDNVMTIGNVTVSSQMNVTRFDTLIQGGAAKLDQIFILYNDTAKQWVFSPNNVSFVAVTQQTLNVTGSIILNLTEIFDWGDIGRLGELDDSYWRLNGTNQPTANWDMDGFGFDDVGQINLSSSSSQIMFDSTMSPNGATIFQSGSLAGETDITVSLPGSTTTLTGETLDEVISGEWDFTSGLNVFDNDIIGLGNINQGSSDVGIEYEPTGNTLRFFLQGGAGNAFDLFKIETANVQIDNDLNVSGKIEGNCIESYHEQHFWDNQVVASNGYVTMVANIEASAAYGMYQATNWTIEEMIIGQGADVLCSTQHNFTLRVDNVFTGVELVSDNSNWLEGDHNSVSANIEVDEGEVLQIFSGAYVCTTDADDLHVILKGRTRC